MPSEGELVQDALGHPPRRARRPDRIRQDVSRSPSAMPSDGELVQGDFGQLTTRVANPRYRPRYRPAWWGVPRWGYPYAWGSTYGWFPYGWAPWGAPRAAPQCFFSRQEEKLNCGGRLYDAEVIQLSGNYVQVEAPDVFAAATWVPLI